MQYDMINHMRVKELFELLAGDVGTQHANHLITDAELIAEIRAALSFEYTPPSGTVDINTGLQV